MKRVLFFIIFFGAIPLFGQNNIKDSIYKFEDLDKEPVFAKNKQQISEFIQKNVIYPNESAKKNIEGKVFVQFVIEKNGMITNIKILKGLDEYCDKEVIRVVKKMPKWTPGEKNNQIVRTYFNLPVKFKFSDNNSGGKTI